MKKVHSIHAAKTRLSSLIERAEAGDEVIIARGATPVAKLTRVRLKTSAAPIWRHAGPRPGDRNPFDRMLIAQAELENVALVSDEQVFDAFPVRRFW